MKKLFIISIYLLILSLQGFSQVQLTQYFMDGTVYNPSFAGSREAICTNMFGRQQWIGLRDMQGKSISPTSFIVNMHAPIYSLNSGLGLNIVYDDLKKEKNFGIKLNYAYLKTLNDENKSVGIGFGISMLNKTLDFDQLTLEQPGDPLLSGALEETGKITDLDLGIQFSNRKKLYTGISITNLLESSTTIGNLKYGNVRNVYAMSEYYINVLEADRPLYLIPSVLIKSNFVNMQVDLTARAEYNSIMTGFSYRYEDAFAILAGLNLKGFRLGLSYDLTTGTINKVSNGSIEIFAGYCYTIRPKVKASSLYNTRYL